MAALFSTENIIGFFILVVLEIVLGIDNVIFVSIIINQLEDKNKKRARTAWMIAGIIMRSMLLLGLGWLLAQKGKFLFTVFHKGFDISSLVMLAGGIFLIYKSAREIHNKLEGEDPTILAKQKGLALGPAIFQIILIDTVFSFDSILTAGGTARRVEIMIAAVVIAMIVMFLFSPAISKRLQRRQAQSLPRGGQFKKRTNRLSSREVEVLQLIAEGKPNKQVALELGVSFKTVDKHRQHLMSKLDIHDISGLTRYAISAGIIESSVQVTIL